MSKEPGCLSRDMMVPTLPVLRPPVIAQVAGVELDGVLNLAGGDVHLDAVVHLDDGVGVADGPPVGGVQVGDGVGAPMSLPDLAQLILGLLGGDPVHGEPSL